MNYYDEGKQIIFENKGRKDVRYEGISSNDIIEVETLMSVCFPKEYQQFLKDYGFLDFKSMEIAGILSGEINNPVYENTVWLTLSERKENELPEKYIILQDSGMGEWYALDLDTGQVVLMDNADYEIVPDEAYISFSEFFYKMLVRYNTMD